jgi:hypothetical protein
MEIDSEQTYTVMVGSMDDLPLVANVIAVLPDEAKKRAIPWFLSVGTEFVQGDEDDLIALDEWQDIVEREIGIVPFIAFGRITWNGHRELIYYIAEPEAPVERLKTLIDSETTRPFGFQCEMDEEWDNITSYYEEKE